MWSLVTVMRKCSMIIEIGLVKMDQGWHIKFNYVFHLYLLYCNLYYFIKIFAHNVYNSTCNILKVTEHKHSMQNPRYLPSYD